MNAVRLLEASRACLWAVSLSAVLSWGALSSSACGVPTFVIEQYAGPRRPPSSIAVIRVYGGKGPDLVSIDGEPIQAGVQSGTRLHIEVVPGPHELVVAPPDRTSDVGLPVRFVAEAGKFYRIEVTPSAGVQPGAPGAWEANAFEIDPGNDARLATAVRPSASAQ